MTELVVFTACAVIAFIVTSWLLLRDSGLYVEQPDCVAVYVALLREGRSDA